MTIDDLHKILGHVVSLMERAEGRAENGGKNLFKYLPKYSILLKRKIEAIKENKGALIEMINVLYDDSFVRMLHAYEEAPDTLRKNFAKPLPMQYSERTPVSPFSNASPTSPLFSNFNLAAAIAAKKAKKGGAMRRRTKRFRRKRRQ